jgi:PBP1b-binding outer membrane lipoprotein LpoB
MKNILKRQWHQTISGLAGIALVIAGCTNMTAPTEPVSASTATGSNTTRAASNEFASEDMQAAQDKLERTIQSRKASTLQHRTAL